MKWLRKQGTLTLLIVGAIVLVVAYLGYMAISEASSAYSSAATTTAEASAAAAKSDTWSKFWGSVAQWGETLAVAAAV